jgi:hypothetical protein
MFFDLGKMFSCIPNLQKSTNSAHFHCMLLTQFHLLSKCAFVLRSREGVPSFDLFNSNFRAKVRHQRTMRYGWMDEWMDG